MLSHFILDALRRVLPGLRQRHGLNELEIADLVDCLSFEAELVEPSPGLEPALTNPQDQPALGTLRAPRADYLVKATKP